MKVKEASQRVIIGEGCTIECEFLTSPPKDSVVVWSKGNDPNILTNLNETKDWTSKYGGSSLKFPSLNVFRVEESDRGYYSCQIQYPEDSAEYEDTILNWPITFLHVSGVSNLCISY
ncbi:Hypothetical predicted protein [Mytilus galloprovincialis]|uniref:Ig-like domain-containing protein n=1 Tax=Mytilus galloprovincialis TaxID=29158 RepID=A0A8B6HFM7_MYTGA|nr:Hypothetical predicted protein [Mytilus galloprovincialis]